MRINAIYPVSDFMETSYDALIDAVSNGGQSNTDPVAVGYIRCGLPDEWEKHFLSLDFRFPSRSTKNRWFYQQKNLIRRLAKDREFQLMRCFFDAEGTPKKLIVPLPLSRRRELAKLFNSVSDGDAGVVLIDHRRRLDRSEIVRCLLCKEFSSLGVTIIEATTGDELTTVQNWEPRLAATTKGRLDKAERQVRAFKSLATRLKAGSTAGRKPFGQTEEEKKAIRRIQSLYRTLPRDKWKHRGGHVIKRRSFREIARCLNEEQVPTRTGAPWSDRMVTAIVKRLGLLGPRPKEPYETS